MEFLISVPFVLYFKAFLNNERNNKMPRLSPERFTCSDITLKGRSNDLLKFPLQEGVCADTGAIYQL